MRPQPIHFSLPLAVLLLHCTSTTQAQPAAAPAAPTVAQPVAAPALVPTTALPPATLASPPAAIAAPPAGTTANVTKILEKAGGFTTLIKLLGTTGLGDRIYRQLNNSNQGMTILAPDDDAFSSLPTGTLNSLTAQQKADLVQFHILPVFVTFYQFSTLSNPVSTSAGGIGKYEFPLNISTSGKSVNMSTGIVNASVSGTIYTDSQVAVYQVDKVLLPMRIFGPQPPALAPGPAKPQKAATAAADSPRTVDLTPTAASAPAGLAMHGICMAFICVAFATTVLAAFAS